MAHIVTVYAGESLTLHASLDCVYKFVSSTQPTQEVVSAFARHQLDPYTGLVSLKVDGESVIDMNAMVIARRSMEFKFVERRFMAPASFALLSVILAMLLNMWLGCLIVVVPVWVHVSESRRARKLREQDAQVIDAFLSQPDAIDLTYPDPVLLWALQLHYAQTYPACKFKFAKWVKSQGDEVFAVVDAIRHDTDIVGAYHLEKRIEEAHTATDSKFTEEEESLLAGIYAKVRRRVQKVLKNSEEMRRMELEAVHAGTVALASQLFRQ